MVRSSSPKGSNLFLRKHRKWPFSPYKARWHLTFKQQQAMQNLKQSLTIPPPTHPQQQKEQNPKSNKPHIISSLIHSFRIYNCDPTPQAYQFVIKALAKTSQFYHIPSVLDHLERNENFETPEYILTDLIKTYAESNRIEDAINLFYRIPKFRCLPSVYSLNTLLSILCRNGECIKRVPQILLQSQLMKIRIEESSFRLLISALCRMNRVGYAIEILNCMVNDGYVVDSRTCHLILRSVCKQKDFSGGVEVIDFLGEMRRLGFCPGMMDYTNVLRHLVKNKKGLDSLNVLNQMKTDGIKPDIVCYTMVMNGVVAEGDYASADKLFDELLVLGLVPDVYTYNVHINSLCKQNNVEAGIKMISCMEKLGCKPNAITYNAILQALCKLGELSRSKELVREMESKGVVPNLQTYSIMVDGLVSKGDIVEAFDLLEEVLVKCLYPPSLMFDDTISGLCHRGLVCKALELVKKMADKNVCPGARVWESLLLSYGSNLDFVDTSLIELVDHVQTSKSPC